MKKIELNVITEKVKRLFIITFLNNYYKLKIYLVWDSVKYDDSFSLSLLIFYLFLVKQKLKQE